MKRLTIHKILIVLIFSSALIGNSACAQWRKIANFVGHDDDPTNMVPEIMTCVYFLDLPGPPRIGFVGTESELYKTTDGGKNWHSVWDSGYSWDNYFVTNICFKDSLTGWFTVFGDSNGCYRTTDGGTTWLPLKFPGAGVNGALCIYYAPGSGRLFASPAAFLPIEVSTDLGVAWHQVGYWVGSSFSFSFSSAEDGITTVTFLSDSSVRNLITSDGGVTWDTIRLTKEAGNWGGILTIANSPICFEADGARIVIRRSDDYGRSWRILKDFGPVADTNGNPIPNPAPYGSGKITGNLSRLYISTDSGFYVSTDSGITWTNEGGPPTYYGAFHANNGVTIAGAAATNGFFEGAGLWEDTWPQAGVAEQPSATSSNNLRVFPNPARDVLQILGGPSGTARLFDLLGRERAEARDDGSGVTLDISHLEAGAYFLRIGNQSAKVEIAH